MKWNSLEVVLTAVGLNHVDFLNLFFILFFTVLFLYWSIAN